MNCTKMEYKICNGYEHMTEIFKFLKFQQLLKHILTVFSSLRGLVQCLWVRPLWFRALQILSIITCRMHTQRSEHPSISVMLPLEGSDQYTPNVARQLLILIDTMVQVSCTTASLGCMRFVPFAQFIVRNTSRFTPTCVLQ